MRLMRALLIAGLLGLGAGKVSAQAAPANAYEPRALQLLQQMADAYARLPALEQQTEFYSALIPLIKPEISTANPEEKETPSPTDAAPPDSKDEKLGQRLRLLYAGPNRLLLERRDNDPATDKPVRTQWVSDGKSFWTYDEAKRWYTQEKAPARLRDFARLASLNSGSLELLMLMGINPFAGIKSQAEAVQCGGTETVRGILTEIVLLRISSPSDQTEVRLYLGKEDSLLCRLVVETSPIIKPPSTLGLAGDPLDELIQKAGAPPVQASPDDIPAARSSLPMKTRVGYDNILKPRPEFDSLTFAFKIPKDALLHEPIDLNGKRSQERREEQVGTFLKQLHKYSDAQINKIVKQLRKHH